MFGWQPDALRASVNRILIVVLLMGLVGAAWWACLNQGGPGVPPYSKEAWVRLSDFVGDLVGVGRPSEDLAYTHPEVWRETLTLMSQTIVMSVLAVTMAGLGTLLLLPYGTRVNPSGGKRLSWRALLGAAIRAGFTVARAVPELVWAFLIVVVMRPGILAGAVALGIHNLGVVGRLSVDLAENTDQRPLTALVTSGANETETFAYGKLPAILPGLLTFLLFRWEVIIRTTVVVGFVVAAGLGYKLRLDLSFFRYTSIATILLAYLVAVIVVDLLSAGLRRLAK